MADQNIKSNEQLEEKMNDGRKGVRHVQPGTQTNKECAFIVILFILTAIMFGLFAYVLQLRSQLHHVEAHAHEKLDKERSAWKELDKAKQSCQEKLDKEKEYWQRELSVCNQRLNDNKEALAQEKLEKEKLVRKEIDKEKKSCQEKIDKEKKSWQRELSSCNQRFNNITEALAQEKLEKEKLVRKEIDKEKKSCQEKIDKEKRLCKQELNACDKRLNEKSDESTFAKIDLAKSEEKFSIVTWILKHFIALIVTIISCCFCCIMIAQSPDMKPPLCYATSKTTKSNYSFVLNYANSII